MRYYLPSRVGSASAHAPKEGGGETLSHVGAGRPYGVLRPAFKEALGLTRLIEERLYLPSRVGKTFVYAPKVWGGGETPQRVTAGRPCGVLRPAVMPFRVRIGGGGGAQKEGGETSRASDDREGGETSRRPPGARPVRRPRPTSGLR